MKGGSDDVEDLLDTFALIAVAAPLGNHDVVEFQGAADVAAHSEAIPFLVADLQSFEGCGDEPLGNALGADGLAIDAVPIRVARHGDHGLHAIDLRASVGHALCGRLAAVEMAAGVDFGAGKRADMGLVHNPAEYFLFQLVAADGEHLEYGGVVLEVADADRSRNLREGHYRFGMFQESLSESAVFHGHAKLHPAFFVELFEDIGREFIFLVDFGGSGSDDALREFLRLCVGLCHECLLILHWWAGFAGGQTHSCHNRKRLWHNAIARIRYLSICLSAQCSLFRQDVEHVSWLAHSPYRAFPQKAVAGSNLR